MLFDRPPSSFSLSLFSPASCPFDWAGPSQPARGCGQLAWWMNDLEEEPRWPYSWVDHDSPALLSHPRGVLGQRGTSGVKSVRRGEGSICARFLVLFSRLHPHTHHSSHPLDRTPASYPHPASSCWLDERAGMNINEPRPRAAAAILVVSFTSRGARYG